MLFSRRAEYALRAMTFLARQLPGTLTGARAISEAEHIPMPFLWKILHNLARHRLIRSFKGLHGGYELARPSDEITLQSVVSATNGADLASRCVLGLPRCTDQQACPLHEAWKEIHQRLSDMLEKTTLADLAVAGKRKARK